MNNRFLQLLVGVMTVCSLTLQSGFAQGTGADQATEKAATAERDSPGQQGIKVHGHWAIDVRNPDGTLVSHREFENALASGSDGGAAYLSSILTRARSVGYWDIFVSNGPGSLSGVCGGIYCYIEEGSNEQYTGTRASNMSYGMVVSVTASGGIMINGSLTATNAGLIGFVTTRICNCAASSAPAQPCWISQSINFSDFTSATISPAIGVLAGQTVSVTVTITFS